MSLENDDHGFNLLNADHIPGTVLNMTWVILLHSYNMTLIR